MLSWKNDVSKSPLIQIVQLQMMDIDNKNEKESWQKKYLQLEMKPNTTDNHYEIKKSVWNESESSNLNGENIHQRQAMDARTTISFLFSTPTMIY